MENLSEHEKRVENPPVTDGGATIPTVTAHHGALATCLACAEHHLKTKATMQGLLTPFYLVKDRGTEI